MALSSAEKQKRYRESKKTKTVTELGKSVTDGNAVTDEVAEVTVRELGKFFKEHPHPRPQVDRFGVVIRERICLKCPGLTFKDLPSHADHLALHNPSPAQWAAA